ncbi:response regulator transcription factor [Cohnella nanjingensis]|uniref:Response regulator n=1 Tax=Cohnella nanjingensis TaxID=1387779 RepID=A0A7X0RQE7_9BACL|nr:response regulator [Cohnella nanjingensis]MBB6671660.1 response regulator [Cohnella nanjingensis]
MNRTKVVIADDEVPIRERLRLFAWDRHGFELAGEARHGQEALELCSRVQPGIVVTDIVMPMMNGLELTGRLKERQPELQVILLTCHREFDYVHQALALGACGYLLKATYRDQDLLDALRKAKERLPRPESYPLTQPFEADASAAPATGVRYEIRQALAFMEKHIAESVDLQSAAAQVGLSPNYFGLLFRRETGVSFHEYVRRKRLERAAYLLCNSHLKVYEVAAEAGFSNYRYFTDVFYQEYGESPREYRGRHG